MERVRRFDLDWTLYGELTEERPTEMARRLADGAGAYVP
jgi:hypothetical protein